MFLLTYKLSELINNVIKNFLFYNFSDEMGCNRCNGSDSFFCHLSNKCIAKSQVCDEKYDCHFQEDERYAKHYFSGKKF